MRTPAAGCRCPVPARPAAAGRRHRRDGSRRTAGRRAAVRSRAQVRAAQIVCARAARANSGWAGRSPSSPMTVTAPAADGCLAPRRRLASAGRSAERAAGRRPPEIPAPGAPVGGKLSQRTRRPAAIQPSVVVPGAAAVRSAATRPSTRQRRDRGGYRDARRASTVTISRAVRRPPAGRPAWPTGVEQMGVVDDNSRPSASDSAGRPQHRRRLARLGHLDQVAERGERDGAIRRRTVPSPPGGRSGPRRSRPPGGHRRLADPGGPDEHRAAAVPHRRFDVLELSGSCGAVIQSIGTRRSLGRGRGGRAVLVYVCARCPENRHATGLSASTARRARRHPELLDLARRVGEAIADARLDAGVRRRQRLGDGRGGHRRPGPAAAAPSG